MFETSLLGQTLKDSYYVREVIAQGGMATVYRARQLSMKREVAIKVLPREFSGEVTFVERFKQEAALAARLEHRAIVPVYDFGEWQGTLYIVMRDMVGGSVDNLLMAGPLGLERTQQIIRQVASALDYAHSQGVLHRDLKPSNILLDANGDAYLTDFGIARWLYRDEKMTASGVLGTPAYMSPEQAQGLELDGRSDIYALGVVLFEMLTGRRPFEAETPYGIAVKHVTEMPPSPRDFNPNLPATVAAVVMRALAKDPAKRYPTASALAGDLDDADLFVAEPTLQRATPFYTPTYQQATPPRVLPVSTPLPLASPRPEAQASAWAWWVGGAVLLTLVLAGMVLLAYFILTHDASPYMPPDFSATGVYKLTATAQAP